MNRKVKDQAVLILAHKNFDQLQKLIDRLNDTFELYIHFDKKMPLSDQQKTLLEANGVHYCSVYEVKWGSYRIVQATLALIKMALANPNLKYFHLVSGQDWPANNPQKIAAFYDHNERIYMDYWQALGTEKYHEKLIWWVKLYFNYDRINRRTFFGKFYHRFLILIQLLLRVDRIKKAGFKDEEIYVGQQWFDVPRDAMQYAYETFTGDPKWTRLFEKSFCSDEYWLQTVLCNSKFKSRISTNIHRYIVWEHRNGSRPAVLDASDYEPICQGDYQWARKFELGVSDLLIEKLNQR